ncbi:hypothetical protein [Vibrio superstes]|nr:hypothetical protein [Vibrio superstes]
MKSTWIALEIERQTEVASICTKSVDFVNAEIQRWASRVSLNTVTSEYF